jgi:hypothetical protein
MNPRRILVPLIAAFVTLGTSGFLKGATREDSSTDLPEGYAKNYLIANSTISPDERFAVMYPTMDAVENTDAGDCLVSLKPFRVLARLDTKYPHFQHKNHGGISAEWSKDSSVALVTLDGKWGPGDIFLFELGDGTVKRTTNLLAKIHALLLPDYRRAKAERYNDYFDFIFDDDGKPAICKLDGTRQVVIDAGATTDPKASRTTRVWNGHVQAIWNVAQARFTSQKLTRLFAGVRKVKE